MKAMVALFGLEGRQELGPGTAMLLVDPIPRVAEGDLVFGPAGHHAGFAVDALPGIHD
jgi:hypothetical protein